MTAHISLGFSHIPMFRDIAMGKTPVSFEGNVFKNYFNTTLKKELYLFLQ